MGITRSTAASRAKSADTSRREGTGRNLELSLLLLISAAFVFGIWLLCSAFSRGASGRLSGTGAPLNLNEAHAPGDLVPLLQFFENPQDRDFAARRIVSFLQEKGTVQSVSDLRTIRVTRDQLTREGASIFRERLQKPGQGGTGELSVPLLTSAQFRQLRPLLSVRNEGDFRNLVWIYGAVFFLSFYVLHILWRTRRFAGDQLLVPAVHILSGFGFTMMIRLRDPLREALLFPDFATGVALGCILAFAFSLPDYECSPLKRLAYVPLLLSFVISLILILFGSGPGLSDAKINLRIGPVQFQPVELIKLLLLFFLAGFFADRWEFLRELRQSPRSLPKFLRGLHIPSMRYAFPMVIAVAIAIAFFFLEKDLGPALVMTLLFLLLYATARERAAGAVISLCVLVGAVWIGYEWNMPHTVSARLSMWLSPWDNYVRAGGDHLAQSVWSFSTGGFWGTGLGLGNPAAVPAAHTDLILAAIGEELGFVGLICVWSAYVLLVIRALRIAVRSSGPYSVFLGVSAALLIALQAAFISAGILGLVPLSGVVSPFVNYGKSSTLSNFLLLGVLASLSRAPVSAVPSEPFRKPVRAVGWILAVAGLLIAAQAARVQVFQADVFLGRGALIPQADGHRRFTYNPRILEAANSIPRGSIFDRNGLPLATSSASLLESYEAQYAQAHVDLKEVIRPGIARFYPFRNLTFHLLGDLTTRLNWGAPNSTYVERDMNTTLQGYDDHATVVRVRDEPGGRARFVLRRDFRELVPLVRYRYRPDHRKVQEMLNRDRDVHLSVDARLQARVAEILGKRVLAAGTRGGAAVVMDPATGELLASVSYPMVNVAKAESRVSESDEIPEDPEWSDSLLDRARYGLYPPGSSFKIVTSIAALQSRPGSEKTVFECKRLPDGRIGNYVRGWGKPIRDDVLDREPHGQVDMAKGLIHSCNAYFAQLGTYVVGAEKLLQTASAFGIRVASPNTATQLKDALPQAAYGQGQVVATPLQMARVAGTIGNQTRIVPAKILLGEAAPSTKPLLSAEQGAMLSQYMRRVVTEGTGTEAQKTAIAVAGKTGTAELRTKPAHAWFIGFAPYGGTGKKIGFAVLIENGRYGGRVAAPAAAEMVNAAVELGLIR
jgi:cell division protein FtsI/penicillin-binding protein 2/cell division protein FtsW (lipid II flippase)